MIFVHTVISSTSNINTITTITGANFVLFLFRLRFLFLFLFRFSFVGLFVRCVLSKPASSCTLLFYFLMVFHFCFLCHKHTSLVGKFQVKTTWKPSCSSAAAPRHRRLLMDVWQQLRETRFVSFPRKKKHRLSFLSVPLTFLFLYIVLHSAAV